MRRAYYHCGIFRRDDRGGRNAPDLLAELVGIRLPVTRIQRCADADGTAAVGHTVAEVTVHLVRARQRVATRRIPNELYLAIDGFASPAPAKRPTGVRAPARSNTRLLIHSNHQVGQPVCAPDSTSYLASLAPPPLPGSPPRCTPKPAADHVLGVKFRFESV